MNLNKFKMLGEDAGYFHVEHPNGKRMSVSKDLLSEHAKKMIQKMCSGGEVQKMADGGDVMAQPPQAIAEAAPESVPQSLRANLPPPQPTVVAPPIVAPPAEPVQVPPAQIDPMAQKGIGMNDLLTQEQQQVADLSKAQETAAGAQAQAYKDYSTQMQGLKTPAQMVADNKNQDDQLMQSYLDKKIDPDHYINSMSTGSRIKAGVAMALGGIGAGLAGQPNQAVEFMKDAINRDMESQKGEQGKAYNLWKMNRDRLGDDVRATIATQNQLWTGAQAKIAMAAANAQSPQAKFHAQQAINDIEKQKIDNRMRMGLLTQGTGPNGGTFSQADPAQLVPSMVPKELQEKVYYEIGKAQTVARNKENILAAFDRAAKENTTFKTGAGYVRTPGSVMALHQLMLPNFKNIDGTVRQGPMDETFHNITPMPGDLDSKIAEKRKSLVDWVMSEAAAPVSKGNGIDLTKFQSTSLDPVARLSGEQQQIYSWAKAHPSNEKAQMALEKFKSMGVGE